ncbi:hypothetical protein [Streptomyces sp. NPDC008125]
MASVLGHDGMNPVEVCKGSLELGPDARAAVEAATGSAPSVDSGSRRR